MKIYLDDEQVELAGSDLTTVLAAAQQHVADAGRSVVEVQINGESITGDALNCYFDGRATLGDNELRLYSADPRILAAEVLNQVNQQLDVAHQAQVDAAEAFQQDKTSQGIEKVGQAMAIWLQVQQAVTHGSALVQLNLDDRLFENQPVAVHIQKLVEQIKTLRDLLAQRDTLGLADTLAYEWNETTDLWQRLVGQVILWIQE